MQDPSAADRVEEATFEFTLGNHDAALALLREALAIEPDNFAAWLTCAEIHFDRRDLDAALDAAQRALALRADDIHANTSLSRIWMERGDKDKAEHFGAQARILGWKDQLKNPQQHDDDSLA